MSKKILLGIALLTAFIFSINYVFAVDNMEQGANNMVHNAENTINNSINKTENTLSNAGNEIKDAGNSVMNAAENVVNGATGAINKITEDRNTNTTPNNNNNNNNNMGNRNYTAQRTATEGTLLGMNATTWTWIIMGLVAIAIIALVWYYSMQTTDRHYED